MTFKIAIKKETQPEDEMILIKNEILPDTKCGVCGEKLVVKIYWFNGKLKRKICCDKCKAEVWK